MIKSTSLSVFLVALLFVPLHAASPLSPPLQRGINLSCTVANAPRQPLNERDFRLIRQAGFDHVRLPIDPALFGFDFKSAAEQAIDFTVIDRLVEGLRKEGLGVVLDMHLSGSDTREIEGGEAGERRLMEAWRQVAHHYRSYGPEALAFELLNEPQYYEKEERYQKLMVRLVAAVREEAPDRLLIVGGPWGSSINGLDHLKPLDDPHVIYAFHYYLPYTITHQGIHMGFEGEPIPFFRHIPYPASLLGPDPDLQVYAPQAPDPEKAKQALAQYRAEGWDGEVIVARIRKAGEWARANKAQVICGEFGVLNTRADPETRWRWIGDVRRSLEAEGIGWELWDYTDLFGIVKLIGETATDPVDHSVRFVDPKQGRREFEPGALAALGLAP